MKLPHSGYIKSCSFFLVNKKGANKDQMNDQALQ